MAGADREDPDLIEAPLRRLTAAAEPTLQRYRSTRRRLEAELPPDRRDRFRSWMGEHHERMMDEMCGNERMRGRSMMRPREEHHDEHERPRRRWND